MEQDMSQSDNPQQSLVDGERHQTVGKVGFNNAYSRLHGEVNNADCCGRQGAHHDVRRRAQRNAARAAAAGTVRARADVIEWQ